MTREWTNLAGRKLSAEYLGHKGSEVALKLATGKITFVPPVQLSPEDNAFLKDHYFIYLPAWQAWPKDAGLAMQVIDVKEESLGAAGAVYATPHFRFQCDVNLGTALMKDLARVFELTYQLHSRSPFGILAKPEDKLFPARLIARHADYLAAGGPQGSAGVYLHKERIFLAPLELMGMKPGSAGWRKERDDYDPTTIVHELTHMLTHEMLVNLPTWANEGFAEYISNIPIEGKAFQTGKDDIRQAIRELLAKDHVRASAPMSVSAPKLSRAEKNKYLESDQVRPVFKISKVLRMTDQEWATGYPPKRADERGGAKGGPTIVAGFLPVDSRDRLPKLYRTAHLMFYYFMEIEGEKGVAKIRAFLKANQSKMVEYQRYQEDHSRYQAEWNAFVALPGVVKLPDGRVQYPSDLTPPAEPKAPFTDPNLLKFAGINALLEGESEEVVGARIEEALIKDLGVKLRFQ